MGDKWVVVRSIGEMFGDLEVGDEGEEVLGGPSEVEGGCVEFWGASFKVLSGHGIFKLLFRPILRSLFEQFPFTSLTTSLRSHDLRTKRVYCGEMLTVDRTKHGSIK